MDSGTRLFTFHGTVAFVDTASGELRHGPVMVSPSNVLLVRDGEQVRIKFIGPEGQQDIVCLPEYSAAVGSGKVRTNDTAITPTVFSCVATTGDDFGLTAHSKFLSAVSDGRFILSVPHCLAWEKFQAREATRNDQLCLHQNYRYRPNAVAFNDTPFKDEFQDNVYKAAWEMALQARYRRIVDLGCGSGFKLMKYFGPLDTVGYEIPPALDFLRATYPGKTWADSSDLASISLSADVLICSDVIEHLLDPTPLLQKLALAKVHYIFLSTPALDLLADRGLSPRLGPPTNQSHVNEWTTQEFKNLVACYLHIIDHAVVNVEQCTQLIVATHK